jgi:hypothetical protein
MVVERATGTIIRWTGGIADTDRARWLKERDGGVVTRPADDFNY